MRPHFSRYIGASTGLGLALVKRALKRGDLVIATARDTARFDGFLVPLPESERNRLHITQLDVTCKSSELKEIVENAINYWGRIDIVVNNAGVNLGVGMSEERG